MRSSGRPRQIHGASGWRRARTRPPRGARSPGTQEGTGRAGTRCRNRSPGKHRVAGTVTCVAGKVTCVAGTVPPPSQSPWRRLGRPSLRQGLGACHRNAGAEAGRRPAAGRPDASQVAAPSAAGAVGPDRPSAAGATA
eukprot:scaffold7773_cov110-Isochrysis_galbana.AAC.4